MREEQRIEELKKAGRFAQALLELDRLVDIGREHLSQSIIRAQLLERLGAYDDAGTILTKVAKNKLVTEPQLSDCEFTWALIRIEEGKIEEAIVHFQKALSLAQAAKDAERICASQLRLIGALADRSGHDAVAPLISQARLAVMRLGDPILAATLHVTIGEMEGKRGLVHNAVRHTRRALGFLGADGNVWLESRCENTLAAAAIMSSEYEEGIRRGNRALQLAEESGSVAMRRASLVNLGNLFFHLGKFDEAVEHFQRASQMQRCRGEYAHGLMESLARVHIARGELVQAATLLARIDASIGSVSDWLAYPNRHSQLTSSEVFQRLDKPREALRRVRHAIDLARRTGDQLLRVTARTWEADLYQRLGELDALTPKFERAGDHLHTSPPDIHAQYERALACALARSGELDAGRGHFERGRRIYEGLHSAPGLLELHRAWEEAAGAGEHRPALEPASGVGPAIHGGAGDLLHDVAMLMMHAGRPELVARHLVAILAASGSARSATAVARKDDGTVEILASYIDRASDPVDGATRLRTLSIGAARGRLVSVEVRPCPGLQSTSTINAVALLVASARELERAQTEREQHLTLWPIEELAVEQQRAVVGGRMTEVMALAQKVARTSASVLITGESGTGKEIVARTIHDHSARADRPFVPFNCTAVPRDMLESQLFGHRRGAFTGADRDYPGLIRTARDGTLFLDEIGEMGLDLQPKLLRFLESGEISPLGEPGPLKVDVRIVAATNADLEQLVRTGRFREDLFYRLNVIPLTVPPLRERRDEIPALVHHFVGRAAAEFSKGRVRIADETIEYLQLQPWPGNVRQLQNEVRRMVALAEPDSVLTPAALAPEMRRSRSKARGHSDGDGELTIALGDKLAPTLARIEKEMIREALRLSHGRVDAAAKELGISRKGLYLKRQRLGL